MKINELVPVLTIAIINKMNVLLKGSPGIGKTEIIEQTVRNLGDDWELLITHPVISDPTDYKGLPVSTVVNGEPVAMFIPYGQLKKMLNPAKKLVVFFDDLGQAPQTVQAACMQIIQQREIDGVKISDKVSFVAATNSRKDNAGVNGLITPLLSRQAGIFEIQVDADSWINWALNHNMPVELVAYIKNKPERLSTFTASKEIENFACPRTIANLGKWINLGVINLEVWTGAVGKEFAVEFMGFYQMFKKVGNLPAQVMLDPKNATIPNEMSVLYFVIVALTNRVKDRGDMNKVMDYIERLPMEMQAFFINLIPNKYPKATETPSYINWMSNNAHYLKN